MLLQVAAYAAPLTGCSIAPSMAPDAPQYTLPHIPTAPAVPTGIEADEDGEDPTEYQLEAVTANELCVTEGRVTAQGALADVDSGAMRAVTVGERMANAAELAFTYRGPSASTEPLANGEVRRQIGLKLRARDTCNVVYVMWHVEPSSGIRVSVKSNPTASTHLECGAGGYINLPASKLQPPQLSVDERHTLRADIVGKTLRVRADDALVWEGELPTEAFMFEGHAGVRSDNGHFEFELRVPRGAHGRRCR